MSTTAKTNYRKWIWAVHILFWVPIIAMQYLLYLLMIGNSKYLVTSTLVLISFSGLIVMVYVHLLYLLPRFFDNGKYLIYGLSTLALILLSGAWRFYVCWGVVSWMDSEVASAVGLNYFGGVMFGGFFILLVSIPLRLIENWFKKRELEKQLKTHQLEAELRFLKAQVNPHFLFNALNNIYSLSFTESKKTPEMILKLSDMMSYMLYDCKSEQVKLSSEIDYLKNYIALQQLKKDGELNVDFKINGDISSMLITPMLFIPFFENAFKHGNLEDTEKGWLKSDLNIENGSLYFHISNSLRTEKTNKEKGGVGLENIRDRLRLLYPGQHELSIKKTEDIFSVNMKIEMN